jgi:hypothetical protein
MLISAPDARQINQIKYLSMKRFTILSAIVGMAFVIAAFVTAGCKDVPSNNLNRNSPAYQPNSPGYPMSPNAAVPAGVTPTPTNAPPNDLVPQPRPVLPPLNPSSPP